MCWERASASTYRSELSTAHLWHAGKKVAPAEDAPPAEAPETKAKKAAGGKAGGEQGRCLLAAMPVSTLPNALSWVTRMPHTDRQGYPRFGHDHKHITCLQGMRGAHCAGKAKAKDGEKKAPAAEKAAEVVVEEPEDAGEGQTAAEREEAEKEEAGGYIVQVSLQTSRSVSCVQQSHTCNRWIRR